MASLFSEGYESATAGAALSATNTTHSSSSTFGGWTCENASPSAASGLGTKYAEISVAAGVARYLHNSFTAAAQLYWRAYIYVPSGAGGNIDFAAFRGGGAGRARLGTNGDGTKFILRNGAGTTLFTSTTAVPIGAWFRLEWHGDSSALTQELRIFTGANLHGSTPTETSGSSIAVTSGTYDEIRTGPANNALAGAWVADYDAVAADNATWVGSAVATNVAPTANAGADVTGVEPWSVLTLAGTDSDSDGTIASRAWSVSPVGAATFVSGQTSATATAKVRGTAAGETITFTYTVTDNGGATGSDTKTAAVLRATEFHATSSGWVPMEVRQL